MTGPRRKTVCWVCREHERARQEEVNGNGTMKGEKRLMNEKEREKTGGKRREMGQ